MAKVFKAVGLWLAISLVVWLITIWRWQNTGHDATTGDIVGQLFVLPVLLCGVLIGAVWAVGRLREQAASPLPSVPVSPAAAGQASLGGPAGADTKAPAAGSDEAVRQAGAWVVAESLNLAVGQDPSSALATLQSRAMRPGLDPFLQDVDGLPVFSARVPDIDPAQWLQMQAGLATDGSALSEPVLRGLALLEAPLHEMLDAVGRLVPGQAVAADPGAGMTPATDELPLRAHLSGVAAPLSPSQVQAREAQAPQLTIRLLMPAHWPQAERELALGWVRGQCGSLLDWVEATQARGLRWVTDPLEQAEQVWDEIDQHLTQWARQTRPELLMLLAVDSAVTEAGIERMQSIGGLFTSAHQSGKVPGEAAAGLLLAHGQWPDLAEMASPLVRIWRPARTRRDKSADAAGRVGTTALGAALSQALSALPVALDQGRTEHLLVISDADHRASRAAELFESLQELVPGLDPMLSVVRVGEACGELGLAGALVPVALASAALRSGDGTSQAALAAHVQSSHERVVVALAPAAQPALQA